MTIFGCLQALRTPDLGVLRFAVVRIVIVMLGAGGVVHVGSTPALGGDGDLVASYWLEAGANGAGSLSSPGMGPDGSVYFGSRSRTVGSGAKLYRFKDGVLSSFYQADDDIDAAPAIGNDGTVYVGSWDGKLHAIRPSGVPAWTFSTGSFIVSSAAIGPNGTIYFGSGDGRLHALNRGGGELWSFDTGDWIDSSPAISDEGVIYFGSWSGTVFAVASDGRERWRHVTGAPVVSSPAIGSDGTVYIGARDGRVLALRASDGVKRWEYATGGPIEGSVVLSAAGAVIVGSSDGYLYALDPATGSLRWRTALGGAIYSTAAARADGSVVIGGGDHYLYGVGPTGSILWRQAAGSYVDTSPLVRSDGAIVFVGFDNQLRVLAGAATVASTAWPVFRRNMTRTGGPAGIASAGGGGGPADIQALPGGSVLLSTSSVPAPGVTVQWQFNGVDIPGAAGSTLVLTGVTTANHGSYRAIFSQAGASWRDVSTRVVVPGAWSRLANLSTRARVGTGDSVVIPGFSVTGSGLCRLLIRAIGDTLGDFGVVTHLADPVLTLQSGGAMLQAIDNWEGNAVPAASVAVGAFPLVSGRGDAAAVVDLSPGLYTAVCTGKGLATGVALVEIYDRNEGPGGTSWLANISCRADVRTGDDVVVVGLVVKGNCPQLVLIRVVGPTLAGFGVTGTLADPVAEIYRSLPGGASERVGGNDDWGNSLDVEQTGTAAGAFPLAPGSKDVGVVASLDPGVYTIVVSGHEAPTGVALVELYALGWL